jgi:catechol 2,3-dioxygenase-like lactoylglutathione lyase family enzyme
MRGVGSMLSAGQVAATLAVSDVERARKFYTEVLGFTPIMEDPAFGTLYQGAKGTMFLMYWSEFAGTNKATAMTINVEDFHGAIAELREKGIALLEFDYPGFSAKDGVVQTPTGPSAWFTDTEGNILSVTSVPSPV